MPQRMFMKCIFALVFLLSIMAIAADFTGKWSGTFKSDGADHEIPQFFILKQQGSSLSGSGGPNPDEQYPIENGKVEGDRVRFELTTGEWKFTYNLQETGSGELKGDLKLESLNETRAAKVSLRRMKEN